MSGFDAGLAVRDFGLVSGVVACNISDQASDVHSAYYHVRIIVTVAVCDLYVMQRAAVHITRDHSDIIGGFRNDRSGNVQIFYSAALTYLAEQTRIIERGGYIHIEYSERIAVQDSGESHIEVIFVYGFAIRRQTSVERSNSRSRNNDIVCQPEIDVVHQTCHTLINSVYAGQLGVSFDDEGICLAAVAFLERVFRQRGRIRIVHIHVTDLSADCLSGARTEVDPDSADIAVVQNDIGGVVVIIPYPQPEVHIGGLSGSVIAVAADQRNVRNTDVSVYFFVRVAYGACRRNGAVKQPQRAFVIQRFGKRVRQLYSDGRIGVSGYINVFYVDLAVADEIEPHSL